MRKLLQGLFVLVISAAFGGREPVAQATRIIQRSDTPSASDFLRWPFPAAIVVGDYVYIDGGELSQLYDGKNSTDGLPSSSLNSTLSISLKESWTNETVQLKAIKKDGSPKFNNQVMWRDPSSKAFYVWGGASAYFGTPPPTELWKFNTDGQGGGSWEQVQPSSVVTFSKLVRTIGGAATQSKDVAYILGGYATKETDTSVIGDTFLAVPGLIQYNMTSGEFKNVSSTGMNEYGTLVYGRSHFIPFGPNGMLLFMGGGVSPVLTQYGGWKQVDFNSLTLYDPKTEKWYTQKTTGSRPLGRDRFCTVGVQGPNGTYEIFIYGGVTAQTSSTSNSVYVLSLPGFVFFKANVDSTTRGDHACTLVGKRQMLSIGGTDGFLGYPGSLLQPDPLKKGIGIFDMTEMRWTGGYDANAKDYESPEVVRQWYSQGGLNSMEWASDEVKTLFETKAPADSTSSPAPGSGSQTTDRGSNDDSGNKTNTGAIAGGVVGGVVAIAAAVIIALYIRRKRKNAYHAPAVGELEGDGQRYEKYAGREWPAEVQGKGTPISAASAYNSSPGPMAVPVELPADHGHSELNTPHGYQEAPAEERRPYGY